jgi:hypothetical protein
VNHLQLTADQAWWIGASVIAFMVIFSIYAQRAAYRNGVTDGYGYARERGNPGYQHAGNYLIDNMSYRWPELKTGEATPHVFDAEAVSDFFDARPVDNSAGPDLERRQH